MSIVSTVAVLAATCCYLPACGRFGFESPLDGKVPQHGDATLSSCTAGEQTYAQPGTFSFAVPVCNFRLTVKGAGGRDSGGGSRGGAGGGIEFFYSPGEPGTFESLTGEAGRKNGGGPSFGGGGAVSSSGESAGGGGGASAIRFVGTSTVLLAISGGGGAPANRT